jgi:hypothetical protein
MKNTVTQNIFNYVRDNPGVTSEDVHVAMSVLNPAYRSDSGNSLIYRFVRAKYFRRAKGGKLTALTSEYTPLPPFKKKKKKVAPVAHIAEPVVQEKPKGFWASLREFFR